jgi:CRISPR/Cas system CMR-associated protein Cmr5 small subunit
MKRIDELLKTAMPVLRGSGKTKLIFKKGEKDCILKEYDGYVASFAPSIITAGLKATLSFYTDRHKIKDPADEHPDFSKNTDVKPKPRRVHVLNLLQDIYKEKFARLAANDLLEMALAANATDERQLKKDLMDCAVALKLVMRNFKQVESETQNP